MVSTVSTGNFEYPSIVVDASGNVHVAWHDSTDYAGAGSDADIFYKVSPRVRAAPRVNPVIPHVCTKGAVEITWLHSEGALWYHVYRSASPITGTLGITPISVAIIDTVFIDTVMTNGTWYYVIVAGNTYYNSMVSNCVSALVSMPPASTTMIPESAFYTVVRIMTGIAVLAIVVGVLAGRRGSGPSVRKLQRDVPPEPSSRSKTP